MNVYGLSEAKIRQIEYLAIRQQRLRETKQNSDELMSFLGFDDIEDFTRVEPHQFIEFTNFKKSKKQICTKEKINCISKKRARKTQNEEVLS